MRDDQPLGVTEGYMEATVSQRSHRHGHLQVRSKACRVVVQELREMGAPVCTPEVSKRNRNVPLEQQ